MMRKRFIILSLFLSVWFISTTYGQDKLLEILKDELSQEMKELSKEEYPPYHMNFRVIDKQSYYLNASFGALVGNSSIHQRKLVPQVRIGDPGFDNFKNRDMGAGGGPGGLPSASLPLDDKDCEDAIRQAIWNITNSRYNFAVSAYQSDKAQNAVNVEVEDKAPCFSEAPVVRYYEAPMDPSRLTLDTAKWAERLRQISAIFNSSSDIMSGNAMFMYTVERRYFVNNEGTEVVQNLPYARLMVTGMTKAEDGMELPLNLSYFAYNPDSLPDNDMVIAETEKMVDRLLALREAPMVDPFTGPAMLSGPAAGVFFHEIFGHRTEGQRMKSEGDGQTFKKMVGQYVLPPDMQVFDDPTLDKYVDQDLNGFYKYDDQGVKAERVNIVVDGKLNEFLMTRTPIDGHPRSNGHARGEAGFDPVSRQSNLIIETKNPKTEAELRQLLIDEAKKQGKDHGYYFTEVTSGFTFTGRGGTNAFNVTPLEVYKVYVDGRPDELVRGVDLIGTPLSMFSNIIYAGANPIVFTGMCGAESGQIPVTAIAPTILVNKVEMQRKNKAQNLLPILKRPELKNAN